MQQSSAVSNLSPFSSSIFVSSHSSIPTSPLSLVQRAMTLTCNIRHVRAQHFDGRSRRRRMVLPRWHALPLPLLVRNESDPTDLDNGGVVTTASAITYGLDAYWTWPCAAGTFSADGYEHEGARRGDPTREAHSTGSCTIGTVKVCPLAGYCPDACEACPSGAYLEVATDSFNKHFQHITQDTCSLCPVGKWQNGSTTPTAHDSLDDCEACPLGEYGDEVGATVCKVHLLYNLN